MFKLSIITILLLSSSINAQSNNRGGAVLFDNGPIVTSLGTGLGGLDESILENVTLGMITFGTGHQPAANLRVADDFVITGDDWAISTIDLFAYQTGEPAPSITAVNLRIWDGVPGAVGSNIVFGDTTTNIVNSTMNSGILRVDENTSGMDNQRQITITNVTIGTTLSAGTYWLDWQAEGTGGSGPFVPHVTIAGQDTTGNALQSTNNGASYANLVDLGTFTSQGIPFIINGSIQGSAPVSVPVNSPWGLLILIVTMLLVCAMKWHRSNKF